ncbi:MAG: hypothetical protein E7480_08600 [Ruminococcaceae bacterium]|nr:hypothetical protein [Oscillospiraceae bacterium]
MKRLVMKDWLFQKVASEHNAPHIWSGSVDAIFQETEKAYRVVIGSVGYTVITWIPKSGCEWKDAENEFQATKVCETYTEAIEHRDFLRSCFC